MNHPAPVAAPAHDAPESTATPTTVRYGVLAILCSLSMITYLDRVCFGSALNDIVKVLGLQSVGQLGPALTAFAFAYAAFEIPTGWLGDVFGPKNTLIRIVIWWSIFTVATGLIHLLPVQTEFLMVQVQVAFWSLVVIRFLFGIGEAGAYPNITRALHNWFPVTERGFAQGTMWMSGRLMGGLTPLVWMLIVGRAGLPWHMAFWIFGAIGIAWCLLFAFWFRDRPEENPSVNVAEQKLIDADRTDSGAAHANVPWGQMLTNGNLWMLCIMYFLMSYGWYFNISYLPSYMDAYYGIDKTDILGAVYKGGPLWLGALGCLIGGFLTDAYVKRTSDPVWGRRIFGVVGQTLCGLCWVASVFMPHAKGDSPIPFFLTISFAAFFNDLTMGAAWSTCQDIGKKHAAIVAGAMNTVGNLGGAVAGLLTGYILTTYLNAAATSQSVEVSTMTDAAKNVAQHPGYFLNFYTFAIGYFLSAALWLLIDSTKPVFTEDEADGHK